DGLAADLLVDDTWESPIAHARLQLIAREEGLHTLGPRDAGHAELRPATTPVATAVAPATPVEHDAPATPAPRVVDVAQVAQVAQVARTAPVAQVAQVAHGTPVEPVRRPSAERLDASN